MEAKQKLRVIVQFNPVGGSYTLIAHTENRSLKPLRFNSLESLRRRFADAGIPTERKLKPARPDEETILYAEDLYLSEKQLRILGLMLPQ